MKIRIITMAVALSSFTVLPAAAQTGRWSVSFDAGSEIAVSGNVHDGGTGTVLALPTTVEARSYGDIYGSPFTWSLGLGYGVSDSGELRVRVSRTATDATKAQVGNVATLPLFAEFDRYNALGMDVGYRQYYGADAARVRPFAGVSAGFVRVDEINGTFTVPAAGVTLADVPMTGSSTVFGFAVSGGVHVPVSANFGIQAGVDFRWQGNLDPVDGLAGTGLEPINDTTRRWAMPITVGAVVKF
jgi:hypothetical protein